METAAAFKRGRALVTPAVLAVLSAPDAKISLETRAYLLRGLGDLRSPLAVEELNRALKDRSQLVTCYEAGLALANIKNSLSTSAALELLEDDSWHMRLAGIKILRKRDDWSTIPRLIQQIDKESGRLNEAVLGAP